MVVLTLELVQLRLAGLLRRCTTTGVQFGNSLITFVSQAQLLRQHRYPVLLKQSEVVDSSLAKGSTNDLPSRLIDDHLRFQGVLLFLATVVSSLFFFGRSMGLSVTSTVSTSQEPAF